MKVMYICAEQRSHSARKQRIRVGERKTDESRSQVIFLPTSVPCGLIQRWVPHARGVIDGELALIK